MNDTEWTGILLCGGKSRRMGLDKGLVEVSGKPLIRHAIDILSARCRHLIISSNNEHYHSLGFPVVGDKYTDIGPIGGISGCLEASRTRLNIILSCDMPFIRPEFFDHLASLLGSNHVAVPHYTDHKYEPMCGIYTRDCLTAMTNFIEQGNSKLPDFFGTIPISRVKVPVDAPFFHPEFFFNVNSREDVDKAERLAPGLL